MLVKLNRRGVVSKIQQLPASFCPARFHEGAFWGLSFGGNGGFVVCLASKQVKTLFKEMMTHVSDWRSKIFQQ